MRTKELEKRIKKLEGEMEELAWMASSLRMHVEGIIEDLEREIADNAKKIEQELFGKYDDKLNQDIFLFVESEVHNYVYKKEKEMFIVHKDIFERNVKYTELEFEVRQIGNDFYKIKNEYYCENTEEKLDKIEKVIKQMNEKIEKLLDYENNK